jgi:plastocyanin
VARTGRWLNGTRRTARPCLRALLILTVIGFVQPWTGEPSDGGPSAGSAAAAPLAATTPVSIVDFVFQPQTVTINVGDQVTWTNGGPSGHTATSDTGVWDSGLLNVGQTFSFTFNTAGSFPYHCTIHPFMLGTINVQGPTSTPTRTLTATSTAAPLTATSTRTITATATPATTQWQATAGAQTPDKAIQALAFFPHDITVDVGDHITWAFQADEVHTLTFLQPGQQPPAFQTAPTTPDSFVYHGTEFVNSGPRTQANGPYSVIFAATGSFTYVCLVHPSMTATVQVNPAGTPYPHDQAFYNGQAAQERTQNLANGQTISTQSLQTALASPGHVTAGGGDAAVFVARFQPQTITITAGQTVTWTNPDAFTPHTVTFGTVAGPPQNAVGTDRAGHATIASNPPSPAVNSGFIGVGRPNGSDFSVTFTTPGSYSYICLLHVDLGMVGTVTVQAPSVTATATATPSTPPVGTTFHALVLNTNQSTGAITLGPIQLGPCPRPISDCVELTVTGSFTVTGTVRGLPPGVAPVLSIPVSDAAGRSAGLRTVTCGPADATGTATCNATVAEPGVFPTAGALITATPGGTPQVTAVATNNNVTQLLATLPVTGNGPCALLVGDACQVVGAVSGSGQVIASMRWTLTVAAGVVPAGAVANAFVPTTAGLQTFTCAAAVAGVGTTCAGTTTGNGRQGGTISVFAGGVQVATGTIVGAGAAAAVVLPPPPPPLLPLPLLPPPPPAPLLPPPGLAPAFDRGVLPSVPIIPEAESAALVGYGLVVLAAGLALGRWRRGQPNDED